MNTRIGLNTKIPENYGFFCPNTRLHLVLSNPGGVIDRVSPSIIRGLKSGTIIDIDGKIDLEKGTRRETPGSNKKNAEEVVENNDDIEDKKTSPKKTTTKKAEK